VKPVRSAIVGTGLIANAHMAAVEQAGGRVRVVAAVDVDRPRLDEFRARYDIARGYDDARAMLAAERPELVQICTPPALHAELSVACLEAGAWVLCEKPLAASLAELDRIVAAEERTGRYCSSVFQWRFGSGAQHLKRLIDSNALGRPLVGVCQTTWYRGEAYYRVPWRGKWATELGGPTMIHGIHAMDLFLWLLGDWRVVSAMIGTLDRDVEVEDVSLANVRFENGALVSIVNSVLSPRQETYLRWDFQKATVELRGLYSYTNEDWRYSIPEGSPDEALLARWRRIPTDVPSSHATQLAALLDDMERGERPLTSGPEARRTIEFISCLYKSAMTGRPVERGSLAADDPFYQRVSGSGSPPPASDRGRADG
jgi:predicted dehydrogenase